MTRHRGGGLDSDGDPIPATDTALRAFAVAPGGGTQYRETARDGSTVAFVVYFTTAVDLINDDELTVRGRRCPIIVNDWRSPWTGRRGLEVLATEGHG